MEFIKLIILAHLLIGSFCSENFETKLALSHALIEEAQIIKLEDPSSHTSYIDFAPPLDYLKKLEDSATNVKTHLDNDLAHLKGTDIYAMEYNNTYFTYFSSEGTYGLSGNEGCFLIGAEAYKPATVAGWEQVATMVKEFNTENQDTEIPTPEKILVPITLDNASSKLKYVGIGTKEPLDLPTTVATRANKLKAAQAFPLYNINTNTFEFREENSQAWALCKVIRSQKLVQAPMWRTLAIRKKKEVENILNSINKAKDFLNNLLGEFEDFTYTLGNKVMVENLDNLNELATLQTELGSHSATDIQDSGQYALANVFLDRFVNTLKDKLQYYRTKFINKAQVLKKVLTTAIKPIVIIVTNKIRGVTNVQPFIDAFKQSIKATLSKYDPNAKVLLQQFQYFSPNQNDLLRYFKVLKFPVITNTYEVTLKTPFIHLIQGTDNCQFVQPTFLLSHCKRLNEARFYSCQYNKFGFQDECCSSMYKLNTPTSLDSCGTEFYEKHPELTPLNYDKYNLVFISSARHTNRIDILCEGKSPEEHETNETSLISTNCRVQFEKNIFPNHLSSVEKTIVTPISQLFMDIASEVIGKKLTPQKPVPSYPPNKNDSELKIFGLNLIEFGVVGGGLFTIFSAIVCATCTLLMGRKKRKRNQEQFSKNNYVMANHPRRETLPIYSPYPTAPNQYI